MTRTSCWFPFFNLMTAFQVVADINFSSMFGNKWIIHRESKNIKMIVARYECS
jgi:hypothetical protein